MAKQKCKNNSIPETSYHVALGTMLTQVWQRQEVTKLRGLKETSNSFLSKFEIGKSLFT